MIVQINEMIDLIDDFYSGDQKEMVVGGIVGTQINQFVIDCATKNTPFNNILFIEGCQDYIGLMKRPVINVKHWTDLFIEELVPPLTPFDPWKPRCMQDRPEYVNRLNEGLISGYQKIVVFDAHLIPYDVKKIISEVFNGQIAWVIDPVESRGCMDFEKIPTIVDSLEKLSPIVAMARSMVGIETRSIDTKVRGTVTQIPRMSKRTIGKIDDKQYMTNDYELCHEIQKRQMDMPFRKNQKVLVSDDLIDMMNENGVRKASIGRNSMLIIENATASPLMKLRLYNSKITYYADIKYREVYPVGEVLKKRGIINVIPANIMTLNNIIYHKYNHSVLITSGRPISSREKYSVLKNSNNVTIVEK